jgi:prepilin-type processing-associated H-X9-DG protein
VRGNFTSDSCPTYISTDDTQFHPNSLMTVVFADGHSKLVRRDFHMAKTNQGGVWFWTHMAINL